MFRQLLSTTLAIVFLMPDAGLAAQNERRASMQEQVLEIPAGAVIELRTASNEKVRGRMGEAAEHSFAVQRIKDDKLETENFAYQDIKSIKVVAEARGPASRLGRTVGYGVLGSLAAFGLLLLVGLASAGS